MFFSSLKYTLFLKDKTILINLIISVIFCFASFLALYFQIAPTPEPVALRYTIYLGVDLVPSFYFPAF